MIIRPFNATYLLLLAFAAGAMIYVVVEELIPESQSGAAGRSAAVPPCLSRCVQ